MSGLVSDPFSVCSHLWFLSGGGCTDICRSFNSFSPQSICSACYQQQWAHILGSVRLQWDRQYSSGQTGDGSQMPGWCRITVLLCLFGDLPYRRENRKTLGLLDSRHWFSLKASVGIGRRSYVLFSPEQCSYFQVESHHPKRNVATMYAVGNTAPCATNREALVAGTCLRSHAAAADMNPRCNRRTGVTTYSPHPSWQRCRSSHYLLDLCPCLLSV